jgi:hypothetical protein
MEEALQCIEATCCDKAAVGYALINAEVARKPSIVVVFDIESQTDRCQCHWKVRCIIWGLAASA